METEVTDNQIWVFSKTNTTEGQIDKTLLGGKGAGLVEMARLGLPVPPGIVIPTTWCKQFLESHGSDGGLSVLVHQAADKVKLFIAEQLGLSSYTDAHPMVSVRSGARVSMPGMMDTILNVGITESTLSYWKNKLGERAALDCYRRLIQMYGQTAMNIEPKRFHSAMKEVMASKYDQPSKPTKESELSVTHLVKLIEKYLIVYTKATAESFPQTLEEQLTGAITAVFSSWNSERAIEYRKIHQIPNDWYTAVVIQSMVFGNMNEQSGSGVLFSRNPSTGEKPAMGEFLPNAQGEEVVSGSATPLPILKLNEWNFKVAVELEDLAEKLEETYRDMVDIEFTVQDGKLYVLQVRAGKRSALAAFRIAHDLVSEDVITKAEALKRVTGEQYLTVSKPVIDPSFKDAPLATGLPGSKGIATGKVWLSSEKAKANPGGILVTKETTPDDFPGMAQSVGILTATGGATSHAAVVARGMDKACVVGCTNLLFSDKGLYFGAIGTDGPAVVEGEEITIDGNTGRVWKGKVPMIGGKTPEFVNEMIDWGSPEGVALQYSPSDELPLEGEVYIDCNSLKDEMSVASYIAHLDGNRPKLRGILSFEQVNKFDDSKLLKTLCLKTLVHQVKPEQVKGLLRFNQVDCTVADHWTVVGVNVSGLKCRVHRQQKTLAELMACDGYYEASQELRALMLQQGVDVEAFAELLRKAGKKVKPVTKPVSREQMAFQVFGK
jgi:pyruvate,orthophosphate dikinase